MTTVIGFDPGNSETSVAAHPTSKLATLTIPSYIGSGTLAELKRIRGAVSARALESGELVLEHRGREMFVGMLALEQSDDADSARGNVARYWSDHCRRLLLASVGALLRDDELSIRVVTGLPVGTWSKDTVRHVQRALVGEHRFVLNGKQRILNVEAVLVVMEGAGALATFGIPDKVPQAVIDIGGRTTDLFWTIGQKPIMHRCKNIPIGVEKIGDLLRRSFEERYGRRLGPDEVRDLLYAYAHKKQPRRIHVDGKEVQLNGMLSSAVDAVAGEIVSFVSQEWRSSEQGKVASDAAKVLQIGGGAYYFYDHLHALIPHLEVPSDPEKSNALGYRAIGEQLPDDGWAKLRG